MSATAIPQDDLRERIIAAVHGALKPVTYKKLRGLVQLPAKASDEPFRIALESVLGAGHVYRWPDVRGSQYFWNVSAEQKAREALLAAVAVKAQSKADLIQAAGKKISGFPAKRLENVVAELIAENQLQKVPAFTSTAKLLVRPGDSHAYFSAGRAFIEKKFRTAGFDPAPFFTDNSPRDKIKSTPVDAAALILDAVRSLEPVKGVPVSTLRLRNHLPDLSKQEFDAGALELRKKQEVFLSQHSDPYNLSQEDKDLLIDGQDGTYYVGIAIR